MTNSLDTTGIILAGGAGLRMGGADKGLVQWKGQRLIEHIHSRLAPQVNSVLISCNRNEDIYSSIATTVADSREDFQGPLAGLEAVAAKVSSDILIVVGCDTPLLPLDLVARLSAPLRSNPNTLDIAYAHDGGRAQYLFAAIRNNSLAGLSNFLDSGQRAVGKWMHQYRTISVDFSDQAQAFKNLNSDEQFQ